MTGDWRHGGALDRVRALFPSAPLPWIDLSTGINPWPYRNSDLDQQIHDHLPTRTAYLNCRTALSRTLRAPSENTILTPGSELAIRLLPLLLPAKRVAIFDPTYGDYSAAWASRESDVIKSDDPLSLADNVDAIIICNPNNPDGQIFEPEVLLQVRDKLAARGGWLIVDEAYCDLTPEKSLAPCGGADGLIVLRSFGKFYGLPGLRLGAAIAPTHLCERLSQILGAWPVSTAALDIGSQAFADLTWQNSTRRSLQAAREALDLVLDAHHVRVVGGTDLFRFIEVADAHSVWRHLAELGLYVRHFDTLPNHLRIGLPANDAQRSRLAEALSLLA